VLLLLFTLVALLLFFVVIAEVVRIVVVNLLERNGSAGHDQQESGSMGVHVLQERFSAAVLQRAFRKIMANGRDPIKYLDKDIQWLKLTYFTAMMVRTQQAMISHNLVGIVRIAPG